jgi:hypothetical protein
MGDDKEKALDAAIRDAFNAEPSPYDSHPSPRDRIALVEALDAEQMMEDSDEPAWSLFNDREAVEITVTTEVRSQIAADHGVKIPE